MWSNPLAHLRNFNIPVPQNLWKHKPKATTENKDIMLTYNLMILSSVSIKKKALRPDIVLRYKKEKKALLNEVSIPSDFGLNKIEIKKMTNYQDLKNEVKRSWKRKRTGIVLVSDNWNNGTEKEEPHKDQTNHRWEHYTNKLSIASCPRLSDDPGKSPRSKTLR